MAKKRTPQLIDNRWLQVPPPQGKGRYYLDTQTGQIITYARMLKLRRGGITHHKFPEHPELHRAPRRGGRPRYTYPKSGSPKEYLTTFLAHENFDTGMDSDDLHRAVEALKSRYTYLSIASLRSILEELKLRRSSYVYSETITTDKKTKRKQMEKTWMDLGNDYVWVESSRVLSTQKKFWLQAIIVKALCDKYNWGTWLMVVRGLASEYSLRKFLQEELQKVEDSED